MATVKYGTTTLLRLLLEGFQETRLATFVGNLEHPGPEQWILSVHCVLECCVLHGAKKKIMCTLKMAAHLTHTGCSVTNSDPQNDCAFDIEKIAHTFVCFLLPILCCRAFEIGYGVGGVVMFFPLL